MKTMISKIALSVLVISSMPMHAGLGQLIQNGVGSMLQSIGNNPGRVAIVAGGLLAIRLAKRDYEQYQRCKTTIKQLEDKSEKLNTHDKKNLETLKNDQKIHYWLHPSLIAATSSIVAGLSYKLARACGWVGSHFEIIPTPANASLGQSIQNGTRTMLQSISNNSGWLAFAALLPLIYAYARKKEHGAKPKEIVKEMAKVVVPIAGTAVLLSAACGYVGSKI